jgi:hypothetical protein
MRARYTRYKFFNCRLNFTVSSRMLMIDVTSLENIGLDSQELDGSYER